jgi:hypothetical protein
MALRDVATDLAWGTDQDTSARTTTEIAKRLLFAYTLSTQNDLEQSMTGPLMRVGAREFREDLARYLDSPTPVAITRHGQTIGYYIPARADVNDHDMLALRRAVAQLESLLAEHGISEDEVVREFRAQRARR